MTFKTGILAMALPLAAGLTPDAGGHSPSATLNNGQFTVTLALPDGQNSYYRGTRFDGSGVITGLKYRGHEFVTPWSQLQDPAVADYEYRDDQIVTGINTTMVGFPEEFLSLPTHTAPGWEAAAVGGTFVKIGVGILRKPDEKTYDHFRLYERAAGGRWQVHKSATAVRFTQVISDPDSGYGYRYTKTVTLVPGKATLMISHSLRNTGSKPLQGMVYDHNFMRWDNEAPGPDYSLQFAFDARPSEPLGEAPLVFNGRTVNFSRALVGKEAMRVLPVGFGSTPGDYDFRIENSRLGIGLHISADQPLLRATLWGMRSVFAIEPFVGYDIQPGSEYHWTYTYQAYPLDGAR